MDHATSARIDELCAWLRVFDTSVPDLLPAFTHELRAITGADRALSFGLYAGEQLSIEFAHTDSQTPARIQIEIGAMKRICCDRPRKVGFFDAVRPHPRQRNKVAYFPATQECISTLTSPATPAWLGSLHVAESQRDGIAAAYDRLAEDYQQIGLHVPQCRALICEGESLLAWIGFAQDAPITSRQRLIFRALIPALRDRLMLQRDFAHLKLTHAGLEAALEAISGPAYILNTNARVIYSNASGLVALAADTGSLAEALGRVIDPKCRPRGFDVSRLAVAGCPVRYLVVQRGEHDTLSPRTSIASARWKLTPREAEILALLARGSSNKEIAVALACAQRTVEVHVTQLFRKAEVQNRSALSAAVWMLM
jgi:DNA-binding CsgD family transcriptional regulator